MVVTLSAMLCLGLGVGQLELRNKLPTSCSSLWNLKDMVNKIPALSSCETTKIVPICSEKNLLLKHYTCAPQCENCETVFEEREDDDLSKTSALGCESDKTCSGYNEVCCKQIHREETTSTTPTTALPKNTSKTPSDWALSPPINSAVREAVLGGDNVSCKRNIFDICLLLCSLADLGK